jgi:hypothetical protein
VSHSLFACDLFFTLSLELVIFLTLTRLVVVLKFINFRFALFTPPLGDFQRGLGSTTSLAVLRCRERAIDDQACDMTPN